MIFFDASETREGSRISRLVEVGQLTIGLEAMTGADMLISPLDLSLPVTLKPGLVLHKKVLQQHCAAGWLVQRKSGMDLVHSIPSLTLNILPRMRVWSEWCWLLSTGWHDRNDSGNVIFGGNQLPTETAWSGLQGSLLAWQLDGGYYASLANDALVVPWLEQVDSTLQTWHDQGGRPDKWVSHKPTREVLRADNEPALAILMALPGIGITKARACLAIWGSLAVCLMWLSDPELYELDPDLYPSGIGLKTVQSIKECLGGTVSRC